MLAQSPASRSPEAAPRTRWPDTPRFYTPLPQRLLTDLHDTPLAIGLYTLVARLFLILQTPIPLSRSDVLRYDPTLKAGAVKRAFDRLIDGGWLVEATQTGHKHRYTPSWGYVRGTPLPWQMDQPCLGRPRHINRLCLDRSLLDICMGKLTPHVTQTATITRYVTTPVLGLADVGCYALTLADMPHETLALRWLGVVRNGQALPLPSEQRLLALISQRFLTLEDDGALLRDTELTVNGTRKLGLALLAPPSEKDTQAQPLFFVPPGRIGSQIGPLIGSLIGHAAQNDSSPAAPTVAESRSDVRPAGITWESRDQGDSEIPPPCPPTPAIVPSGGGGAQTRAQKKGRAACSQQSGLAPALHQAPSPIPDTEATQLLKSINVRPEQLIELAEMPKETVELAIADGKARDGVRDLAGWVVSLLRTQRDYGWKIALPAPRPDSPEALRAAFARYAKDQEVACCDGTNDELSELPLPAPAPLNEPGILTRLWNEVQATLKLQLTRQEFDAWIRSVALESVEDGVATLVVSNAPAKDVIESRYMAALRDLLALQIGEAIQVRVILNGAQQERGASRGASLRPCWRRRFLHSHPVRSIVQCGSVPNGGKCSPGCSVLRCLVRRWRMARCGV